MKKIMSLLLSVLLILSFVPMAVSADEVTETWNTLTYKMDGPEFSLEATEFEGSDSYKFYAAAYDAEGRLRAVKSAAATMDGTSLKASINFEPGVNDEAPTDIDVVKTMLWKGLTPVAEAGEFDDAITPMTYDEATDTYSSITNGFYRELSQSTDYPVVVYAYEDNNQNFVWSRTRSAAGVHNDKKLSDSTLAAWYGNKRDNGFYIAALAADSRVDKAVAYVHNHQGASENAEFYMVTTSARPYATGTIAEQTFKDHWATFDNNNSNVAENGVYYLDKMAEGHKPLTMNDPGAKQVFNIPENAGNFGAFVAKVTYQESRLRVAEIGLYEKVTDSISYVTERPEYNVATNAAAFAYGEGAGSEAYLAVDGNAATSWISLAPTTSKSAEVRDYLVLDLGTAYSVSSIKATVPSGASQNFTVYGANDAKQTDKTQLTDAISGLTAGVESDLGTIKSTTAFRYIIFEQAAAETSFGFSEIKINSTQSKAASHTAVGPVEKVNFATYAFCGGPGQAGNNGASLMPKIVDADPATESHDTWNPTSLMFDMGSGNEKKFTHIVYQNAYSSDFANGITFIATNSSADTGGGMSSIITNKDYVVLGTLDTATFVDGDTGLLVFNVPAEYQNTAYRFVGMIKAGQVNGKLGASTFQAYTKYTPEYNVAENAAAFAYGEAAGSEAYLAVDGKPATSWISLAPTTSKPAEVRDYLVLDLGTAYSVSSIKATVPSGASQNFTVYGANDAKQTDKTQLTDAISGLTAGVESDLGTIKSTTTFRYIIFEQAAAETNFGFSEIKVNSTQSKAASHTAVGPVEKVNFATHAFCGGPGQAGNNGNLMPNIVDADPATESHDTWNPTALMFDMGSDNEKKFTHIVYQNAYSSDFAKGITFIATNSTANTGGGMSSIITNQDYVVLGTLDEATFVNSDTGLLVFNVPAEYQDTAYRFIGMIKAGKLGASTFQAYAKIAE